MFKKNFSHLSNIRNDFGKPDSGFNGFDLAEKGADAVKPKIPPMLQQSAGFRGYFPVMRIWQRAPGIHLAAKFIDNRRGVVLLGCGGKPLAFIKD